MVGKEGRKENIFYFIILKGLTVPGKKCILSLSLFGLMFGLKLPFEYLKGYIKGQRKAHQHVRYMIYI